MSEKEDDAWQFHMTTLSIGPFKGVREEHRAGAARHACEHAKAALASALRQADKIDDVAYAHNAYFPSLPAVTCPEKVSW